MAGDHRHLPERHVEVLENIAGAGMAQRLDIVRCDPAEAEPVGDIVQIALEPGKAVDERAIEIENHKRVAHQARITCCVAKMA